MKNLILFLLILSTSLQAADKLTFKLDGKEVTSVSTADWKKGLFSKHNSKLKQKDLKLYHIYREYEKTYVGYDFAEVMDSVYGQKWRKSKKIGFRAKDGFYRATLTSVTTDTLKSKKGILAFKEKGKDGFTKFKKGDKTVDPGEISLLWSGFPMGFKNRESVKELQWPYQLESINIVQ